MVARRSDWETSLTEYLTSAAGKPHAYGSHDCLMFVAGAVKAQTDKDFARGHRGKYRSAVTGARYLKKLGFGSAVDMVDARLPEKPIAFAQRGDIVADEDGVPGVCIGGDAVFLGMEDEREGLVRKPRQLWSKAWAV